jgi:hypothetical protein
VYEARKKGGDTCTESKMRVGKDEGKEREGDGKKKKRESGRESERERWREREMEGMRELE